MPISIRDAIASLTGVVAESVSTETVDTLKCGHPDAVLTGVVVCFTPSLRVVQSAVERGANLIISHEPVFYSHRDETGWLEDDLVYRAKRGLLDEHGITVWRYHDYVHMERPDPIVSGAVQQLGWQDHLLADEPPLFELPALSLRELVGTVRQKLGASSLRTIGDPEMTCRRVGLMVGAPGGRAQVDFMRKERLDVLVCGEVNEWETPEYVRDAVAMGHQKALVVVGHCASEEPGVRRLHRLLEGCLPGTEITFAPAGDPFAGLT